MKRRDAISGFAACAVPAVARAQGAGPVRRIAIVMSGTAADPVGTGRLADLRQGLGALGWVEGKNIQFDVRFAAGDFQDLRNTVSAFVESKPNVIVVASTPAVGEVHKETRSIPVVFMSAVDPVGLRYIDSLARPGGNITGFVFIEGALFGKWLQLLKEVAPSISHATLLHNPANTPFYAPIMKSIAGLQDVAYGSADIDTAADIERVVGEAAREPNGSVVLPPDPFNLTYRRELADAALRFRLPLISVYPQVTEAGGLMSYGPDTSDFYRRAATYIDRILNGARPGDLPAQTPTRYELKVNLKTAKTLSLTIPPLILARADEVIE